MTGKYQIPSSKSQTNSKHQFPKKNRHLWLAVSLAVLALAACGKSQPQKASTTVEVNGHTFAVEVADTEATRGTGLSNRTSLEADAGMLFLFDSPRSLEFYMKDCYFPIDIAFIDANWRIINVETMAVEPDPANPRRIYYSDRPAQYALEVLGGAWQKIGAKPGMQMKVKGLPKGQARRTAAPAGPADEPADGGDW